MQKSLTDYIKHYGDTYCGSELINKLTELPDHRYDVHTVSERLQALLDIYKIFIPNTSTIEIYHQLNLALCSSLEKKQTALENELRNDNFREIKGAKRYGIIGGLESFRVTGSAGIGKTSSVQRCIDLIMGNEIIELENPYRKIIPILFVECVADGSFKGLLFSILRVIDEKLGTSYFINSKRSTITVDVLLASVSNILINHVAVLVIDEIERIANESRKGETLINFLTQLINQANIPVCFVGNESANRYFQSKEYLGRRAIGISLKKMQYDFYYHSFIEILFKYQYTKTAVALDSKYASLFFKLSNGIPSMLVSLFAETQKTAIIMGEDSISIPLIEQTFEDKFLTMKPYLEIESKTYSCPMKTKNEVEVQSTEIQHSDVFSLVMDSAKKDVNKALQILSSEVSVSFI